MFRDVRSSQSNSARQQPTNDIERRRKLELTSKYRQRWYYSRRYIIFGI